MSGMSDGAASGAAAGAAAGAGPAGGAALNAGPRSWCRLPLDYELYLKAMANPNVVWKNYKRPHAGQPLTRKYHTAAVMAAAAVKRPCICTAQMKRATTHPWTGEPCLKDSCVCGKLLADEGALTLSRAPQRFAQPRGAARARALALGALTLGALCTARTLLAEGHRSD